MRLSGAPPHAVFISNFVAVWAECTRTVWGTPLCSLACRDVQRTLAKADDLYQQWTGAQQRGAPKDAVSKLGAELKSTLRGIEWDVEDLQVSR